MFTILRIDGVVVEEDIEVAMTDTGGTELSGLHLLTPARDREGRMEGKDLSDSREEGEIGLEEAGAYVRDANDST